MSATALENSPALARFLVQAAPEEFPKPAPLSAKVPAQPYPIDALPHTIRAAVAEVQAFTKAPMPLVASSALAALSLASQAHIDVKRAERLLGPASLFLLTIADSGERKSTCDGFFTAAVREWEAEQAQQFKPEVKRHAAAKAAWEAEREGLLAAIKAAAKGSKPTENLQGRLVELEHRQPKHLQIPRLLLGDETAENLAWRLAKDWPSAGVVSSEAGLIFGAHAMGKDSIMRSLGLLNILWDGGTHSIGRRTSESFTVRGARLTVALQVQEATLRSFFEKSGALARGTGFLARFLIAWPESTQGQRRFTEAPASWPHLAAFNRRISALLAKPVDVDEDGALQPTVLALSPEAKQAWVEFHDGIEADLASGGDFYDVRDVASKAADNAARLAALFHHFEDDAGPIKAQHMEDAALIVAWHLEEARRFFGELALPAELADAVRLDGWLLDYCRRKGVAIVAKNHVRQHGPLRDGTRLDIAIEELSDLDRLRLEKDGKRLTIRINPELLEAMR